MKDLGAAKKILGMEIHRDSAAARAVARSLRFSAADWSGQTSNPRRSASSMNAVRN